jgi:U3 small nucleolar RNA-associated protein 14
VKESYEEQLKLGEELTRKMQEHEPDNEDGDPPAVENPVQKDRSLKGLFDMKFMREAEERREADFEELQQAVSSEKGGIVTIAAQRPPLKIASQPTPPTEKVPPITSEKPPIVAPEKVPTPSEKADPSNPWLSREKKRTRRFVSATSFHQPTPAELTAAEDRINLARRDEQRELLADAMGLSTEFAAQKTAAAEREAERGVDDMSALHLDGWGAWTGPGVVESAKARERREQLEAKRAKVVQDALRERKDAQMPHVVLREGPDPAVEKYSIPEVPRMYTSAKQLQAQLAFPIAPEVNSVAGFRQLTAPEISADAGGIIEPIFFTKMQKQKAKIEKRNRARKGFQNPKKKL